MSERALLPAVQKYRACAKEIRRQAQSFRDPKARTRMRQIAADYDRKARQVEAVEPLEIRKQINRFLCHRGQSTDSQRRRYSGRLKRSERFDVAVTVVWLTVAVLVIVLILALMPS